MITEKYILYKCFPRGLGGSYSTNSEVLSGDLWTTGVLITLLGRQGTVPPWHHSDNENQSDKQQK